MNISFDIRHLIAGKSIDGGNHFTDYQNNQIYPDYAQAVEGIE